jgi:hypothetical protein
MTSTTTNDLYEIVYENDEVGFYSTYVLSAPSPAAALVGAVTMANSEGYSYGVYLTVMGLQPIEISPSGEPGLHAICTIHYSDVFIPSVGEYSARQSQLDEFRTVLAFEQFDRSIP